MRRFARVGSVVLAGTLAVATLPAAAIEVCRPNALGQIVCFGKPTRGLPVPDPFTPSASGLSRVQEAPGAGDAGPSFIPSIRTNEFGDTLLNEGESRPPKPRICQTDTFGDLRC